MIYKLINKDNLKILLSVSYMLCSTLWAVVSKYSLKYSVFYRNCYNYFLITTNYCYRFYFVLTVQI